MRVLLVIAKYNYPNPGPSPAIFPQGPAYVVAALKAAGHEVAGCNAGYASTNKSALDTLCDALRKRISQFQPQAICVGGLSADYLFCSHTIQICRKLVPDIPMIIGGGLVSADRHFIMSDLSPDFAIAGDAEIPIVELVNAMETGADLRNIRGLAFWRDGVAIFNPLRVEEKVMPDYPLPSYDEIGINDFFRASSHSHATHLTQMHPRPRMFPVSAGRSCPFRCTFCFHSSGGGIYSQRAITDVINEISFFHDRYHYNYLAIYDELFSVNEVRVREFCDGIRSLNLDFKWTCAMRVPDLHEDLLRDMKDAGCSMVGVGFESACDTVLQSMNKHITVKQIRDAIDAADKAGIIIQAQFIFGDPAETEESIKETSAFANQHCKRTLLALGKIIPYPSSQLYNDALQKGIIPDPKHFYSTQDYNLTNIPSSRLDFLINESYSSFNTSHSKVFAEPSVFLINKLKGEFDDYNITFAVIQVTCPFCNEKLDFIREYPGDIEEVSAESLIQLGASHTQCSCTNCHNNFLYQIKVDQHTEFTRVINNGDIVPSFNNLKALQLTNNQK